MATYPADLFAATHQGTAGDVEFYRQFCAGAASVLELGCGYGRLLRELVDVVPDVHGLDFDDAMLGLAARTRAHLHSADMTSFDLKRRFDRILIPHSGLYCLLDAGAVDRCLARVHEHLAPGGLLALDCYIADAFHDRSEEQTWDDDEEVELAPVHARGRSWRLLERSHWDRGTQRIDVDYRYLADDGTCVPARIEHRYLLRPQLREVVERAGFDVITIDGGFRGERWRDDAESVVVICRRTRPPRRSAPAERGGFPGREGGGPSDGFAGTGGGPVAALHTDSGKTGGRERS